MHAMKWALACGWLLAGVSGTPSQPAGTDSPAVRAARVRQEAVTTLDIQFKQMEVIAKGAITTLHTTARQAKTLFPEVDTKLESMNRLQIAGDKVRYENNHPRWDDDRDGIKRQVVRVVNAPTEMTFFLTGIKGSGEPQGILNKAGLAETPRDVLPFMLTF